MDNASHAEAALRDIAATEARLKERSVEDIVGRMALEAGGSLLIVAIPQSSLISGFGGLGGWLVVAAYALAVIAILVWLRRSKGWMLPKTRFSSGVINGLGLVGAFGVAALWLATNAQNEAFSRPHMLTSAALLGVAGSAVLPLAWLGGPHGLAAVVLAFGLAALTLFGGTYQRTMDCLALLGMAHLALGFWGVCRRRVRLETAA